MTRPSAILWALAALGIVLIAFFGPYPARAQAVACEAAEDFLGWIRADPRRELLSVARYNGFGSDFAAIYKGESGFVYIVGFYQGCRTAGPTVLDMLHPEPVPEVEGVPT